MNFILPDSAAYRNRFATSYLAQPRSVERTSVAKLLQLGNALHKAGKVTDAETIFRKVLERHPDHPMALLSLGIIAHQSGLPGSAIRLIGRAVEIAPNYAQAYNNLGNVYAAIGSLDLAIDQFSTAISLRPDYADAHFNLGAVMRKLGRTEDALTHLNRCKKLASNRADVHFEIGQCHYKLGNRINAQIAFRTAAAVDPRHVTARLSMGTILCLMGRNDEAIAEFRAALDVEPQNIRALNGLGECLKHAGAFEDSLELLNQAQAIEPNDLETLNHLASTYQSMGDNAKAADYYERVLAIAPGVECAEKSSLFVALNRPDLSSRALFALHRRLRGRHDRPHLTTKTFPARSRDPHRKIRIGYVSSDFRTHVVALNIMPLITNHDRDSFEIFLYAQEKTTDRMTEAFKKYADRHTAINRYSDAEAAALIERDEIDILVILAGRFDENRPLIAAYRPAPVQVSFHDCATSGLAAMDYYLTDAILHPEDTAERFTENLYRLPTYYQYPVQDGLPALSAAPARRNGFVTFGCFNKPEKINDEVVALWAEVLRAVSGSKLFLKYFNHYSEASMQRRWIAKFAAHGVGEDRLILAAKHESRAKHLSLYHDIDIALDPFPFNGATTTFEALSMGVPVVCLAGRHFVDRVATSMVTHAGLPELAAPDRNAYVARAASFAGDLDKLDELRASIRDKLHGSSLCDGAAYARSVEAAFRDMWRTWAETGGYRGK